MVPVLLAVAAGIWLVFRVARGWTRPRHIAEVIGVLLVLLVALSFRLGDRPIVPVYSFWISGAEVVVVYWMCLAKSESPYTRRASGSDGHPRNADPGP